MSDLPRRLRIKASMIALGERIAWGSDTAIMEEAADMIEALSAAAQSTPAAQGAVPEVSAMARVLSDRSADACNIDRDDNWAMYGQEYIEDVQAMLAASTGQEVGK